MESEIPGTQGSGLGDDTLGVFGGGVEAVDARELGKVGQTGLSFRSCLVVSGDFLNGIFHGIFHDCNCWGLGKTGGLGGRA